MAICEICSGSYNHCFEGKSAKRQADFFRNVWTWDRDREALVQMIHDLLRVKEEFESYKRRYEMRLRSPPRDGQVVSRIRKCLGVFLDTLRRDIRSPEPLLSIYSILAFMRYAKIDPGPFPDDPVLLYHESLAGVWDDAREGMLGKLDYSIELPPSLTPEAQFVRGRYDRIHRTLVGRETRR